ncbi:chymotrypsin-1-like [Chironomus tepperi]|uniref:chymotrypsin-1-like n=1 Tax=Chironomus tepperi TaxID=113505 RepID=UPI00391F1A30
MFLLKAIVLVSVFYLGAAKYANFDDMQSNIVGGSDAKQGSAPYQVSLQLGKGRHNCGGAIIDSRFILTAAHCLEKHKPNDYVIMAGSNKISEGSVYYTPEKFIIHNSYDMPEYHNDIALIRLKEKIQFTDNIQQIEYESSEVPVDEKITLTGWGRLNKDGPGSDNLQEIQLTHISYEKCKESHKDAVGDGHLCTYNKVGEGTCNADSGSPLTYKGKLVAVVNFGTSVCALGIPDAHAKIAYYNEWIRTNMENNQ